MGKFLDAMAGRRSDTVPMWIMRQAGRYMPEYQKIREKNTLLKMFKDPDIATEVTLQPIKKFGMDAAIVFSDILIPAEGMGIKLDYNDKVGPILEPALRSEEQLNRLDKLDLKNDLWYLYRTLKNVRAELPSDKDLIGFAGAPWTLATYLIEGNSSRKFAYIKYLRYNKPELLHAILDKLTTVIVKYCLMQMEAGAQAIQLFDSSSSGVDPVTFRQFVYRYASKAIHELKAENVPVIYFSRDTNIWLDEIAGMGADVISVDWSIEPHKAVEIVGGRAGLQGNLDPYAMFAPRNELKMMTKSMVGGFYKAKSYIANLGHGIMPDTPEDSVRAFIEAVREESARLDWKKEIKPE